MLQDMCSMELHQALSVIDEDVPIFKDNTDNTMRVFL